MAPAWINLSGMGGQEGHSLHRRAPRIGLRGLRATDKGALATFFVVVVFASACSAEIAEDVSELPLPDATSTSTDRPADTSTVPELAIDDRALPSEASGSSATAPATTAPVLVDEPTTTSGATGPGDELDEDETSSTIADDVGKQEHTPEELTALRVAFSPTLEGGGVLSADGTGGAWCALTVDGHIVCWKGHRTAHVPVTRPPEGRFIAVSVGYQHSCAVRLDNTVLCWGSDRYGGTQAPSGTFTSVSVGNRHSCGIRSDSTVTCWGGTYYQSSLSDSARVPPGQFASIRAQGDNTCGVRLDGELV